MAESICGIVCSQQWSLRVSHRGVNARICRRRNCRQIHLCWCRAVLNAAYSNFSIRNSTCSGTRASFDTEFRQFDCRNSKLNHVGTQGAFDPNSVHMPKSRTELYTAPKASIRLARRSRVYSCARAISTVLCLRNRELARYIYTYI